MFQLVDIWKIAIIVVIIIRNVLILSVLRVSYL